MTGVGLYGVLAYATVQRTKEIGIRMALGAQRFAVVRLVLTDMAKVAIGWNCRGDSTWQSCWRDGCAVSYLACSRSIR